MTPAQSARCCQFKLVSSPDFAALLAHDLEGFTSFADHSNANLDELAQRYAGAEAAIEATSNYYHIHDTLSEYLDVTVASPGKLKLIANSDKKTDRVDAKELARMVRLNAVPESYVSSEEIREARALSG